MVIGLKYGKATLETCAERERTYELVREFVREYTNLHGSVNCTDLLGYDLSDPVAHAEAQENALQAKSARNWWRMQYLSLKKSSKHIPEADKNERNKTTLIP
jgi:hypothetical protein